MSSFKKGRLAVLHIPMCIWTVRVATYDYYRSGHSPYCQLRAEDELIICRKIVEKPAGTGSKYVSETYIRMLVWGQAKRRWSRHRWPDSSDSTTIYVLNNAGMEDFLLLLLALWWLWKLESFNITISDCRWSAWWTRWCSWLRNKIKYFDTGSLENFSPVIS